MTTASIELELTPATQYLLRVGDSCLILAQRISEWCGHAPVLEEDIAMSNIALDLIGQAQHVTHARRGADADRSYRHHKWSTACGSA